VDGYHGVELDKENRHKTTFAIELGLYRYLCVPQGYLSSEDSYTKHTDAILDDCPEKPSENDYEKIVDDIIQWSETMEHGSSQSVPTICMGRDHGDCIQAEQGSSSSSLRGSPPSTWTWSPA
jgi:hypothetical protein